MIKIYLKVEDGKVVFAIHLIRVVIDRKNEEIVRKLSSFQVEKDGIVIYSEKNLFDAELILQKLGISYTVEELEHNTEHVLKAQGIKYNSRTEAIKHLLEDIEPDSQIIPNMNKKLDEKESKIKNLENKLTEKDNQINQLLSEFDKIKNDVAILKNKNK